MKEKRIEHSAAGLWGSPETHYFYHITPDRILDAVEAYGVRCTGRCLSLQSLENRVYEVEIEVPEEQVRSRYDRFRVVKFYRPGRWSREQILEEHAFLRDLAAAEIPAVAPLEREGRTLGTLPDAGIYYAVFPKVGGRSPVELSAEQLVRVGRLLARVHTVGASQPFSHRLALTPEAYGLGNLSFLLEAGVMPPELTERYRVIVESICEIISPWFKETPCQRVHGDAHLGNLLWADDGLALVDLDDAVRGPVVQDLWLMIQGRDADARRRMETLLSGYEQLREFDASQLRLVEPLRALRMVHYSAWIAHRREDPAFKTIFHHFGGQQYWMEQIADLQEQLEMIRSGQIWTE